jgi:hypothetical protein
MHCYGKRRAAMAVAVAEEQETEAVVPGGAASSDVESGAKPASFGRLKTIVKRNVMMVNQGGGLYKLNSVTPIA